MGIGDLGPAAFQWIDYLAGADQRWWQMLPLGPCAEGNSPYRCYSAFAGNPLLISLELMVRDGLLSSADMPSESPSGRVNYEEVTLHKTALLNLAHGRFLTMRSRGLRRTFDKFLVAEAHWLDDYALFMALRESAPGQSWTQWPRPLLHRDPTALKQAAIEQASAIHFHQFLQFIFFRQLAALRSYAKAAGVALIGDMPIFVSPESADVWTHPKLFQLDRHCKPTAVSGVPPDLFSSTGQSWGNPLYNWKEMARDGFAWWKKRLRSARAQADLVRIDHFRGFEAYWRVPASAPTAETGRWVKAPGADLFNELFKDDPNLPLLAEDLGIITPEVESLRDRFGLPGMRVLQFGFGDEGGNPHTPHNFIPHCFAYTGTHDNDTTVGWFKSLSTNEQRRIKSYEPLADWKRDAAWSLIRMLWKSSANHAIVPLQDLLGLNSKARMNRPGESEKNWEWRLSSFSECRKPLDRLAELTRIYERK